MREKANPLYIVYLAVAAAALLIIYVWFSPAGEAGGSTSGGSGQLAILPPKAAATQLTPTMLRSPQGRGRIRIGIVAGHSGSQNDPGAVCPDGLTEVSINQRVADLVVAQLNVRGIQTDLMEEFDERQIGYRASALISIHADACLYEEATGFKVASLEGSANQQNDSLVSCLAEKYAERTGLPFHANSITYDMTQYHVFDVIDAQTPGAIIEVGFMLTDRPLLTEQPELVAQGIVDGLLCYLERVQGQHN